MPRVMDGGSYLNPLDIKAPGLMGISPLALDALDKRPLSFAGIGGAEASDLRCERFIGVPASVKPGLVLGGPMFRAASDSDSRDRPLGKREGPATGGGPA